MNYAPQIVNLHIRASDEETLQRLQYANNLANSRAYNYQTPYESKDGDIVVWFFGDIVHYIKVTEEIFNAENSIYKDMDTETLIQENAKLGSK